MDREWRPSERTAAPERKAERQYNAAAPRRLPGWWWMPLAALAVLLLLTFYYNRGANDGPQTPPELELQLTKVNLASAYEDLASCQEALASKPAAVNECSETAFRVLRADLAQCSRDLAFTKETVDERKEEFAEQQATIADAARRICCAQRIENNAINSYDIVDNKIVCATNGDMAISC